MNNLIKDSRHIPVGDTGTAVSFSPITLAAPGRALPLELLITGPVSGEALPIVLLSHGHGPSNYIPSGLAAAFAEIHEGHTIADRVKSVLKRSLASGRPEVAHVARDLRMSERTLQRRITDEATTFRALLLDARRELSQELLADRAIHIDEVTYLLGYQDTTSFYRAFKDWAGVSPGEWRSAIGTGSEASRARH